MPYCPFRHFPQDCIATAPVLVRLACLIHAANVRSEPGSNPSKVLACSSRPKPAVRELIRGLSRPKVRPRPHLGKRDRMQSLRSPVRHDSKNSLTTACAVAAEVCASAVQAWHTPRFGFPNGVPPNCQRAEGFPPASAVGGFVASQRVSGVMSCSGFSPFVLFVKHTKSSFQLFVSSWC